MNVKKLRELPYYERPDLTPYLIHLTRKSPGRTALANLFRILRSGVIKGTGSFVQGGKSKNGVKAACFMDVPFAALKYVCSSKNSERYEAYGIVVRKQNVYLQGGRPVLYMSDDEQVEFNIPPEQLWRVVSLEYDRKADAWIDWQHEREWRCPIEFNLKKAGCIALVKSIKDVTELQAQISQTRAPFNCVPLSIIPLSVICQGFGPEATGK
jgi:hypothetical protein